MTTIQKNFFGGCKIFFATFFLQGFQAAQGGWGNAQQVYGGASWNPMGYSPYAATSFAGGYTPAIPGYNGQAGALPPALSYGQSSYAGMGGSNVSVDTSSDPVAARANVLIAYWEKNKAKYDGPISNFDAALKEIENALGDLDLAKGSNLVNQQQVGKVIWLLKLIKMKVILSYISSLKSTMPDFINQLISQKDMDAEVQVSIAGKGGGQGVVVLSRNKLEDLKSKLEALGIDFKNNLLPSAPTLLSSPPPELAGLSSALQEGYKIDQYLDQQLSCIKNPQQPACSLSNNSSSGKQRRSQNSDYPPGLTNDDDDTYNGEYTR